MLSELIAYALGKRKARKDQIKQDIETEMAYYDDSDWETSGQDTRSLEQLLKEARKNRANKNHK